MLELNFNSHHPKNFPMLGSFCALFGFFVAGGFAGPLNILINQSNICEYLNMYFCFVVIGWLVLLSSIFMRVVNNHTKIIYPLLSSIFMRVVNNPLLSSIFMRVVGVVIKYFYEGG